MKEINHSKILRQYSRFLLYHHPKSYQCMDALLTECWLMLISRLFLLLLSLMLPLSMSIDQFVDVAWLKKHRNHPGWLVVNELGSMRKGKGLRVNVLKLWKPPV